MKTIKSYIPTSYRIRENKWFITVEGEFEDKMVPNWFERIFLSKQEKVEKIWHPLHKYGGRASFSVWITDLAPVTFERINYAVEQVRKWKNPEYDMIYVIPND